MQTQYDIFISYSDKDRELALKIYEALKAEGFNCWIAFNDIPQGEVWSKAITQGIRDSQIFLLILTPNSNTSDQVLREIEYADKQKKKLFCYKAKNIVTSAPIDYFISSIQQFEVGKLGFSKGIGKLIEELKNYLGKNSVEKPKIQYTSTKDNDGIEKVIVFFKWVVSILFLPTALFMFFEKNLWMAGLGYLLMGLLLLPPLKAFLISILPFMKNRIAKTIVLVILVFFTGAMITPPTVSGGGETEVDTTAAVVDSAAATIVDTTTSNNLDYSKLSIEELIPIAQNGDVIAQLWLGRKYDDNTDYSNAMKWYLRSANQGLTAAKNNIGYLYMEGHGVQKNYELAMQWFNDAATGEYSNATAKFNIGYMYFKGLGVVEDKARAKEWFLLAAKSDSKTAKEWLKDEYGITNY